MNDVESVRYLATLASHYWRERLNEYKAQMVATHWSHLKVHVHAGWDPESIHLVHKDNCWRDYSMEKQPMIAVWQNVMFCEERKHLLCAVALVERLEDMIEGTVELSLDEEDALRPVVQTFQMRAQESGS